MLCILKVLFGTKELKRHASKRAEFAKMIRVMLSMNQATTYVTQAVRGLQPFSVEGTTNSATFRDLEASCVFAYTSSIGRKTTAVDDNIARSV